MRLRCTLQSLQSICCSLFIVFEPGSGQNVNELIAVIAVCCPWNPRRLMFARYLGAIANVVRGCTRFDRKGYVSYIFWLARAILAVLLLCILRCPRAALAGPPILVSCILCLCLPLASVLLRCRVCLCLACILSLCLCLAPVLNPTTARMSVSCVWHRLVRPCLWCTCERACVTILFSPSQAPEVGYPQRPQLKQKQQAARTSAAQPRSKLSASAMTWPTAGNVIAPAIRPSTSVMDILPDRPQLT